MAERIAHRGPDGAGTWTDASCGIALGHRRLSILDLSPAGHQPMLSANGKLALVFNGEIYNHHELRSEIEDSGWNTEWKGHSDTETLLASLTLWGLEETLRKLNGMFAFALWDRETQKLFLARDRLGEKPLYYGRSGNSFLFASELKALTQFPEWSGQIDRSAVASYLRFAYVPDPQCIYTGMAKLSPAHWVEVVGGTAKTPVCYWDLSEVVAAPRSHAVGGDAIDELERRLRQAVKLRMESDVPLGAFLSGGVDSSAITALMQAQSSKAIKTFTIGFSVPGFNEAEHAKAVAAHLGTDHTEMYVSAQDALNAVPDLPYIWDEPFADSSQIPTLLLSRMTKPHVTVALSGDAGDELFCGYNRYAQGYDVHRILRHLPDPLRQAAASTLKALPAQMLDRIVQHLPSPFRYPALGDRLNKLGDVLAKSNGNDFYWALVSHFRNPGELIADAPEHSTVLMQPERWPSLPDFRETMMYLDTLTYLPGDILTKVDRASMAAGLEARSPFLDHTLVEYAWTLPLSLKLARGQTKWILREVLRRYVPDTLIDRPKMGFGVPIEQWLAGPLKDWAEDLLSYENLSSQGYFEPAAVRQLWTSFLSGKRRWHYQLWTILMFNAWLRTLDNQRPTNAF